MSLNLSYAAARSIYINVKGVFFSEWEAASSPEGYELFHTRDAVGVVAAHWSGDLRLFGRFKGQEPVGLLPLFVRETRVGRIVSLLPVGFGIGRLGPVVMSTSPKQRKREVVNKNSSKTLLKGSTQPTTSRCFESSGCRRTPIRIRSNGTV